MASIVTLNGGFTRSAEKQVSNTDRDLIAEFMKTKGVTQCPPSTCDGNEVSPDTHNRIMEARKQFRTNQRAKKAKEQK
jgi:SUMO ligase MMS21 Smc5/6 complex component